MLNKLLELMRRYRMVQPGDRVICAVSGGADSMALLWAMYLMKDKLGIELCAAHFNHGLRGEESDRDEKFVRDFCQGYDIPLFVGAETVVAGKKGLEAAAREARYGFFKTLSGKIATAHTADDNAETVVMHLIRGTGLKGLGAIAPVNGNVIRPMLCVTRQEVLAFLRENHIPYVEDSTNAGDDFLRNRIRHNILPLMRQENPQIAQNLSAMAMDLRKDAEALNAKTGGELPSVLELRSLPEGVRRAMLGDFLKSCGVKEPERKHIAAIEGLVFSPNPSASVDLPGNVKVCRNYDRLEKGEMEETISPMEIPYPGVTELPKLGLRITCVEAKTPENGKDRFTAAVRGKLILRSREEKDAMRLPGGTKSLKKIFIDRKIPRPHRCRIPVFADEEGVVGVFGIGGNQDRLAPGITVIIEEYNPKGVR